MDWGDCGFNHKGDGQSYTMVIALVIFHSIGAGGSEYRGFFLSGVCGVCSVVLVSAYCTEYCRYWKTTIICWCEGYFSSGFSPLPGLDPFWSQLIPIKISFLIASCEKSNIWF